MSDRKKSLFRKGMHDGIPIGLGYLAVAFTLGISAGNDGMNFAEAGLMSLLMHASAGEFAAMTVIAADAGLFEMIFTTIIVNMRYMLMSCALSQKLDKKTKLIHRFFIAHFVTDELFGISMALDEPLKPAYYYGAVLIASPGWVLGTIAGTIVGNVLPASVSACLSIALYGMFIAIVVPPAKKNRTILALVVISMLLSTVCTFVPFVRELSSGTRIIILTVLISAVAAIVRPVEVSA